MTGATLGEVAPAEESPPLSGVRRAVAWLSRAAWPAFCLLIAVWAIGYVFWPFSSDQGVLSWVGRIIADGGMPYRDAWEIRGPAPFLVYAAIARMFGAAQWPLRVVDLAIVAAGAWSVGRIAATFGERLASRCAIALYLLWYASLGHHDTAQSDGWNAAIMAGVTLSMLARNRAPAARHAAIAGVLIGLSILSKPPYAAFLILPGIIGITQVRARGARWLAGFWGAGVLALVASAGAVLLWLHRGGAMDAFIDIHIRWLLARYTDVGSSWFNRVQTTGIFLTSDIFATAIAPAIIATVSVWHRDRPSAVLLLAWLGGALLTVMAQGNFYAYHWHPVYPALAVLAGIGIALAFRVGRRPNDTDVRLIGMALGAAAFAAAALRPLVHAYRIAFLATGLLSRERFDAVEFGPYGPSGPFAALATYFHTHTRPDEPVFVWGSVAGVYYIADRHPPTRFGYAAPLVNSQNDDFRRRYRRELIEALEATPPSYIAALAPSSCARRRDDDPRTPAGRVEERMRCVDELPELAQLITRDYVADSTIGAIALFRRRALPVPGDSSPTRTTSPYVSPGRGPAPSR